MKFKKLAITLMTTAMLASTLAIPASASSEDSNFKISITNSTGTFANNISFRKKDNSTSSYVKYNIAGPSKIQVIMYGASSANGTYKDVTTYIHDANGNKTGAKRRKAIVSFGTKGFVRQDIREVYGSAAWASIRAKYNSSTGIANGKWSPDSTPESGCIEYND